MLKYLYEVAKHGSVYTIGNILTRAMGILLVPLYTHYLTTSDYGIVSNVVALVNFFSIIFLLGMDAVWGRFYFDYKDRSTEQKKLLGSIFTFLIFWGLAIIIIVLIYGKYIFNLILPNLKFWPYILIAIFLAFASVFFKIKRTIFRVRQQSVQFGLLSLVRFSLSLIFIIIGVAVLQKGALGKVVGEFTAWFLVAIICIILINKDLILGFNWRIFKPALQYGLSVIPHSFSGVLVNVFDRFIMTNVKGLGETGVYTIGFQVGSIMNLIVMSFNLSWSPFFMKTMKSEQVNGEKIISRLTSYLLLIIAFIGIVLVYFSSEIIKIIATPAYYNAMVIVPVFVFSFIINGAYFLFSVKIFYIKRAVKYIFLASFTASLVNLVFNLILIPKIGMIGAAWARLISNSVLVVITFILSQKFLYIKYDYKFFIIIFIMTLLGIGVYEIWLVSAQILWIYQVLIKFLILVFFLIFPFLVNVLKFSELKRLVQNMINGKK